MTRYELFRKRIAPIAFILAVGLMARETCQKQDRTTATIVLDYGNAASNIKSLDADLWAGDDVLAHFHRADSAPPRATLKATLPEHDAELRFDVDLVKGGHRHFTRRVHADDGATVTVLLESELWPPGAQP